MFDKFKNAKTQMVRSENDQLTIVENAISDKLRRNKIQAQLIEIQNSEPMNLDRVMDIIGTLGTDNSINQSIIDGMRGVLGNNSDPVAMTKYFSGLIAQRVLTIADVRKIPGNLFASRGGVPLDVTSNLVYVQPIHLFGGASLIQPARFAQSPLSIAFDDNGEIIIGADTFSNYTTATDGSYTAPFVAHLFILKRKDTLKGDSKFFIESEFGYKAGLQLTDDTAAVLMLNHKFANKVTSDITLNVATPPDLIAGLSFNSSNLDEQFEVSTNTAMDVTIEGVNVSITHYQLPMYTPISEAILASLISGRLDMLPTWILNNLSAQFKF